ncbi:uncharacterized protein LOC119562731 isoform X4 [Drosophila subpulchrella]|uniref:uncharacterized protein LOC119562731 isoform X4 n=1 Tax=Drosophila subpulchrella TaxID=1486046 RepID=UPI0018A1B34B|nr:uncharacterized protein LOC119562731 isoform X4 [Drosophila subpulchrella]
MEGAEATVDNTRMQMELLLSDICQENIEQLRGARKHVHVYMEVAQILMEAGFDVSYKSYVRTKIENLTKSTGRKKLKWGQAVALLPRGSTMSCSTRF